MRSRSVLILIAVTTKRISRATAVPRNNAGRQIVDLDLHLIDPRFLPQNLVGEILVLLDQRQDAAVDRLCDQPPISSKAY